MKEMFPPFTTILLAICVIIALASNFGQNRALVEPLLLTLYPKVDGLPEIRHGELWRLFTPMFLHFSQLHIIFNAAAFWSVGGALEQRRGAKEMSVLVLVFALGSNLAEFLWSGHGFFGGMSGVLFGLFSYLWILGRLNPGLGLIFPNAVIGVLLVWFVLCWVGIIPNVANMAHTGGLALGLVAGFVAAKRRRA